MKQLLLDIGLLSVGLLLGGLLVSLISPSHRFWPLGERDWTFWASWGAWTLYVGSLFGVAFLDWHRWFQPSTFTLGVSSLLLVAGTVWSLWAFWRLGFRESSGLEGELNTEGPYRYSRNPQYVGYIAMLAGGAILAGSWRTAVLALLGIVWFLLAPRAEEPWLRDQYGAAYEAYCETVPRFVGWPRGDPSAQSHSSHTTEENK